MPGISTTGSPDVALLDSQIIGNLCDGKFYVDITPSVYIADGQERVLGANVEILNPYGVIIKAYGTDYEIAPDLSGAMDAVISFNIPTTAGNYQYGKYTINVELTDSEGNSWIVTKTVKLCEPDRNDKTKNYGSLSAKMKVNCATGKLVVLTDGVPTYGGKLMESQVMTGTLEYPTSSGLAALAVVSGNFAVQLFEGVYKLEAEICATYNFGDNVFVKVKYKIKKEHNARCLIDECCVLSALAELQAKTETDCTDAEKSKTASLILEALSLYELVKLSANCGEDPSDYIDSLEKLLGCKCSCNCLEGTPIINSTPVADVVVQGCNIETSVNGLTTTYTINNYEYKVSIAENGGILIAAAATQEGCVITTPITFDIVAAYSQIKTLANQNNTEGDFWASVVNKSLRDIDPACLGITNAVWAAKTLPEKFTALITKMCACCGTCDAVITDTAVSQVGADVRISWEGTGVWYEVYLDGVLMATILAITFPSDPFFYIFSGAGDSKDHTWMIIAKCADGTTGETETGTFGYTGCPDIVPPVISSPISAPCPYNLTALTPPIGYTREWHTANNTTAGSLVTNPASASGGLYYAFDKQDDCYSPSTAVTLICDSENSCTAPQNPTAYRLISTALILFQSAAYPPPGNSYTVKRRLASAPDVGGSYTTLGNAVWDVTFGKWRYSDSSYSNNTLYVYRIISNCGSTEPSVDVSFVNLVCPTMTLYPTDSTVAYSFIPVTSASKIEVEILDETEVVIIHTDTYTPAFANPITGLFEYLTAATNYKVRLKFTFAGVPSDLVKYCNVQLVTTDIAP